MCSNFLYVLFFIYFYLNSACNTYQCYYCDFVFYLLIYVWSHCVPWSSCNRYCSDNLTVSHLVLKQYQERKKDCTITMETSADWALRTERISFVYISLAETSILIRFISLCRCNSVLLCILSRITVLYCCY